MKLNKSLFFILLLITINIILLIILQQLSSRNREIISTYQKSLLDIKMRNEKYIENILKYDLEVSNLLANDIKIIDDSSQTLFLTGIMSKYKFVIYFPKMACKDCLGIMFKLITENPKFNTSDFLIISDFYSLGELKFYKKEFNLNNYDLFLIEKPERMEFIKYPIVFSSKKNRLVFLFDKTYYKLLNEFLNHYR